MSIVTIDYVDNHDGSKTRDGYQFTRKAIVEDLSSDSGDSDEVRLYDAINNSGLPNIGDPHPAIATCTLNKIEAVAIEPNYIELKLIYSTKRLSLDPDVDDPASISMDSSLVSTETSKDKDGENLVKMRYLHYQGDIKPDNPEEIFASDTYTPWVLPVVPKLIPSRIYMVRKKVAVSVSALETINHTYQGTVNSVTWRGYGARKWLCLGISWYSEDGGLTYIITYQFQYNPNNYDVDVFWREPTTGKVPFDATDIAVQPDAGKTYTIYEETDFNNLNLS